MPALGYLTRYKRGLTKTISGITNFILIIRFASGLGEAMEIADEQCDAAKDTTVQMVKVGFKMVGMWTE